MLKTAKLLREIARDRQRLAWKVVRRRVMRRIIARETASPTWRRDS